VSCTIEMVDVNKRVEVMYNIRTPSKLRQNATRIDWTPNVTYIGCGGG